MKKEYVQKFNSASGMNVNRRKGKPFRRSNEEINFLEEEGSVRKWFADIPEDPEDYKPASYEDVQRLREEARIILENDTIHHKHKYSQGASKSNNEWLQTMVSKGTSQDRIAASVILIQNSPIYSLHLLRNLISLVKGSKRECVKAMEVLADLFISDLLVPHRKLRYFDKNPLSVLEKLTDGNAIKRKMYLLLWYFEDALKKEYFNFVSGIKDVGHSSIDANKEKSIIAMQKLLVANSEQESLLLSMLVNKIGDPVPKIASNAIFHLNKVVTFRRYMKVVVMEEIQKLLFRPNIGTRAQYYGICFLSQLILDPEESGLACKLIYLYFSFFKACVKKGDIDSRMMSILLAGVNRAFPFSKKDELQIKEHIETMYKIVHIAHFNVSVQAMCLLFQVCDYDSAISDRFYSVLYQKILDPSLSSSSQHAIFLSLIFRSLSKDLQFNRVKAFIKRLLQVCHYVPVHLVCAILVMISHLLKKNQSLQSLTLYATEFKEENEGSDEEHYEDIKLEEEVVSNLDSSNVEDVPSINEENEKKVVIPTWYHASNLKTKTNVMNTYKPYSRNPLFVCDVPVFTELVSLSTHYHPTVSLFASRLLQGAFVEYTGDPLRDFTLSKFLDRWVFKNPKLLDENKLSKFSRKPIHSLSDVKSFRVNSDNYLATPENRIPPEELFMYRYLKQQEAEGRRPKKCDDDVSSVASDEFEGMMSQIMGGKENINYAEEMKKTSGSVSSKQKKKKGADEDSLDSADDEVEDISDDDDNDNLEEEEISDEDEADHHDSKRKRKFRDSGDDSDDSDDYDNENNEDNDEEVMLFDSDGEEDFEFNMSDVEREEEEYKLARNRKKVVKNSKKNKKSMKGISDVFAPAEEFAEMLENTGEEIAKYGNLTNISNRDNAGVKQLKWEMARDRWVKGHPQKRRDQKMSGKSKQPPKKWRRKK